VSHDLEITLFVKPGCHLCDEAIGELERLRRRYPHTLRRVDITSDPNLFTTYGLRIPVLQIDGREHDAPLEPSRLEQVLREAVRP
jgi:hypothetical protein